jgi:hypothetical protein
MTISGEATIRLLIAVGGLVAGVASTVAGSWVSSKIHGYHENRKAHLEEIKQKVLIPINDLLANDYAALVAHKASAVVEQWGVRIRKQGVSVLEHQTEEGPILVSVVPNIDATYDPALHADANKNHFSKLLVQIEEFAKAWRVHASECQTWVTRLSEEIIKRSPVETFPAAATGKPFVNPYKLGVFIYRRSFGQCKYSLLMRALDHPPVEWTLEGFEGTSAKGTKQQLETLVSVLDNLVVEVRDTADRLQANARLVEKVLNRLRRELSFAIASRRLRAKCDLVPFF